jgi:hypothetical protein
MLAALVKLLLQLGRNDVIRRADNLRQVFHQRRIVVYSMERAYFCQEKLLVQSLFIKV